ncbi:MAG: TPMT family class I SAM-dependent methyltransferase [Bacteroidia bacterium]|jgi:cyclopropane fatty-acyl-phospholipid synthase-like methyltransferase|nr:TPMT family class I SAM-dependent methyltransferase [Bacteroidia bacterium]
MEKSLDQSYWNQRYAEAQTGWDIGYPSPALTKFVDGLRDKNQRILIPGCGNAYEAEYLLQHGFNQVTLIDIAPLVVNELKQKLKQYINEGRLRVLLGDFFELNETFDTILEQTFFCALPPTMRQNYASHMYSLLAPKGTLAGLLFCFPLTDEGPPFGGSVEEYERYFGPYFEIQKLEACYNSIKPREGRELFVKLMKI